LRIYIEDNGRGFDPNNPQIHGMGLEIMRERATSASARLTISSTPGKGTKIEIFWPQTSNGE
jgi:signal transduction histidine kinase